MFRAVFFCQNSFKKALTKCDKLVTLSPLAEYDTKRTKNMHSQYYTLSIEWLEEHGTEFAPQNLSVDVEVSYDFDMDGNPEMEETAIGYIRLEDGSVYDGKIPKVLQKLAEEDAASKFEDDDNLETYEQSLADELADREYNKWAGK